MRSMRAASWAAPIPYPGISPDKVRQLVDSSFAGIACRVGVKRGAMYDMCKQRGVRNR